MKTTAYDKRERTVAVILVHEENDDVQAIPVMQGAPNKHAIRVGENGTMDSVPGGDDWIKVVGEPIIVTGLNGICETTAAGDDVQIIAPGNGMPDQRCVGLGDNNFRNTNVVDVNDRIVADGIGTGPDGICNSVADNTNVLSTDFGTEATIRDYLNNVIYNQAVVWWSEVSRLQPVAVNFDLNRDGAFDVSVCNTTEMLGLIDGARAKVLATTNPPVDLNSDYEFNVFLVDNPSSALLGTQCGRSVFVFVDNHSAGENANNTIAHELGHAQGLSVHPDQAGDPDTDNLMHSTDGGERLRKGQWYTLHSSP
jgi:hypothetical protein